MASKNQPQLKYQLRLEPDLGSFSFKGEVTITLVHKTANNPAITLDARELEIVECKIKLHDAQLSTNEWLDCAFETESEQEKIIVHLPEIIQKSNDPELLLFIRYNGSINDQLVGFYRSQYQHNGHKKYVAVTQFEEQEARRALPCFDHPSYKALFDIEFLIPQELQGISNTPIKEEIKQAGAKKLLRFKTTPLMSTYLLFFGVGDFEIKDKKEGRWLRVITTPGKTQYGDFGLDFGEKALCYGEEYTTLPFPIDKLDLIAVPDFAYGAMENFGAVTFRENLLLVYPGITSKANFERIAEIIAHEIAHMWFGNIVTPVDWKYIWLNESFATIFGFIIADHYFPEWEMGETFVSTVTSRAMSRDALIETIPVELPNEGKIVINTATAPIIYSKGACILRMLQGYLGAEAFQKGTRHFLKTYAYACASSDAYWQTFGEATQIPLNEIMENWIHKPGFPLVSVKKEADTLLLSQQRFTYLPHTTPDRWWIPINIVLLDKEGNTLGNEKLILKEKTATYKLPKQAAFFKINAEQAGFFITRYDQEQFQKLGQFVASKKLAVLDRYGLHSDFHALLLAGQFNLTEYLHFLGYYMQEDSFHPLINIIQSLHHLYLILDTKRALVGSHGKKLFHAVLTRIGLEPQEEEGHSIANLRDALIWAGFIFGEEQVTEFAENQFKAWLSGKNIHPDIQSGILKIGAKLFPDQAYINFTKRLESANTAEHEKINILAAMGCFAKKEDLFKALDYTLAHVPNKNKYIPIASAGANPDVRSALWVWYKDRLATLEKFYPVHYERVIVGLIPMTGLGREEEVKTFFDKYPFKEQFADTIKMALELLTINAGIKKQAEKM